MWFKRELRDILKPRPLVIVLLGIFLFVAYAGDIQRWGITYDEIDRAEHPPPFLYDQLRGLPFWTIWVLLIIPLIGLNLPIGITNVGGAIMSIIYFYLLSCILRFLIRKITNIEWFDDPPKLET